MSERKSKSDLNAPAVAHGGAGDGATGGGGEDPNNCGFARIKNLNWKLRRNHEGDLWICLLLPVALLLTPGSDWKLVLLTAITTWSCFVTYAMLHLRLRGFIFHNPLVAHLLPSVLVWILLYLLNFLDVSWLKTALTSQIVAILLLLQLPKIAPGSFTLAESMLLSQGAAVFFYSAVNCFLQNFTNRLTLKKHVTLSTSTQIQLIECLTVLLVVNLAALLYISPRLRSTPGFIAALAVTIGAVLVGSSVVVGRSVFAWFYRMMLSSQPRVLNSIIPYNWMVLKMFLSLLWLLLITASFLYAALRSTGRRRRLTTIDRKVFHVFVAGIFLPGLLLDPDYLHLASVAALCFLIVLEVVRLLHLPVLSTQLERAFRPFVDSQDSGHLLLTHIYLLCACALPLWLHPSNPIEDDPWFVSFAGIFSVAVGDGAASVCGTAFGQHKWPGREKTLEGTLCSVGAQMICYCLFSFYMGFGLHFVRSVVFLLVTVVVAYVEAVTEQIDNILLPLLTVVFLTLFSRIETFLVGDFR